MSQEKTHYAATRPSNRNYRVYLGDELLLESNQAIELKEHYDGRDFDAVVYFPAATIEGLDARPTDLSTFCPIKGYASYLDFRDLGNGIWYYAEPLPEVEAIRDHVAFDQGKGFRIVGE